MLLSRSAMLARAGDEQPAQGKNMPYRLEQPKKRQGIACAEVYQSCGCLDDFLLLRGPVRHGQHQEQHTAQANLAILRRIPLCKRVRPSALAARAH